MHPKANRYLDAVEDPEIREALRVFFDAFDAMDRENTHLRLRLGQNGCPYGHAAQAGYCALGYPGCACMDDLIAIQAWEPADEAKAAVRLGRLLEATKTVLDDAQQTLVGVALHLEATGGDKAMIALCRKAAAVKIRGVRTEAP
jgi:hypothetical protein